MGDRLGTQGAVGIHFFHFFPPIFNFYPSVKDFCIPLGTFGLHFDMIYPLHTSCIDFQVLWNQRQTLWVMSVSTIAYLWAARHSPPYVIKIFSPVFFTVNLFPAPLDRILCHAQFTIEAQSPQKRPELPSSVH